MEFNSRLNEQMHIMYSRTLAKTVKLVSNGFPVLMLTGPRQVGKSTLLEMCAKENRTYVTLDDTQARILAKTDPGLFVQEYPPPVMIDEVQYAPELFSYIKLIVDREKKDGLYWLTGPQKFNLMKGVSKSLAGRVGIIDLLGLSQAEIDGRAEKSLPFLPTKKWVNSAKQNVIVTKSVNEIYKQIWLGSFPKLHTKDILYRDTFYTSYVQTYIQRDVKDLIKINDDTTFGKFLSAVAARTGQLLNYTELGRDVGIDTKTAKAWLSVLETSGLIYLLKPYYANVTKRLVKTPKLYFLDTGLCSFLTGWPNPDSLQKGNMSSAILETYIFSEILKSYWHNGKPVYFYYYRDLDQKEIDLVIDQGDTFYPIEYKKTGTPSLTASKHFHVLEKFNKKIAKGAVICLIEKDIPLSREVTAIPVSYL